MKLTRVNTFKVKVEFHLPTDKPSVLRPVNFLATFESLPQDELDTLRVEQEEKGNFMGLLDRVLVAVDDIEPEGTNPATNEPYTALEIVKVNQFSASAASHAFWEAVNKDYEKKISKKLRNR